MREREKEREREREREREYKNEERFSSLSARENHNRERTGV